MPAVQQIGGRGDGIPGGGGRARRPPLGAEETFGGLAA